MLMGTATTTMLHARETQNVAGLPVRPTTRRSLMWGLRRVCFLVFLSLGTGICQESPTARPALSMPWHLQGCISALRVPQTTSVPLTAASSSANCAELARLLPSFPRKSLTDSGSADTRPDETAVEA